ncbi:lymphoid-restricted membrane protein isoform X1 [Xenopus tropicalis]|uniref:Inositol 1,4,5-triphosphate receptor associated 2 n=2 Tax=Xenopus tropicalis TaxID=8364 RepID=A0A803J3E5_XENTR|nr:lymphoid-restricted membrane protein isoform X1 [Xenopus tropicalis]XP_031754300.1 lymphoid-restricted membrane protein isoform X1 [Xenopus tropicalis]
MADSGSATKRHNPVDSICRKIKTIQMRDQDSNPNLQIPKFQSRNFDSPQSNTKKNLEEVLKNRTVKNPDKEQGGISSPGGRVFSPGPSLASPCLRTVAPSDSPLGNAAYSINLTVTDKNKKIWPTKSQSCSTPVVYAGDLQFKFSQSAIPSAQYKSILLEEPSIPCTPSFYFADRKSETIALQSPVVKRLSLSETAGFRRPLEHKAENASEVSLICEEDLLDSIFHACDSDHRGKVAVSKIVDYLRHTTSRGSEDSGLDELCNMLDPEKQDISMDLETYQAIMKEWIDDCRNNCTDHSKMKESALGPEESMFKLRESLLAVRRISGTMNITSGSLEAFGGDISRGDLETSDLITCVADLQYNNQKLQEQQAKLKATIEALEEANHRLLEENEELHNQWKSSQQAITRARVLKEELEEMKTNMSSSEERKAQVVAQNKLLEKDNLSLIHKISGLQEENMRGTLEAEGLRKSISEITDKVAILQMQLSESENALQKRDATLHMKELYIEELRSTLMDYASVIENLRTEKSKLENNLHQMEQELLSNGISSPITHKFSRMISGSLNSLQSELELAQQSPEVSVAEWMNQSGQTTSLDITLDREVLLLLQGPGQDQAAVEFKSIMQSLQGETCGMADLVLVSLRRLIESNTDAKDLPGKMLEIIKADLKEKRSSWTHKLKQLEKHRESLDKEFVKMAGSLRRLKTEQVHMRKELSARCQELEMARQRQEEAEGRTEAVALRVKELALQEVDFTQKVGELEGVLGAVRAQNQALAGQLDQANVQRKDLLAAKDSLTANCQLLQHNCTEQQKTIQSLQEKLFKGQLCRLLCQNCSEQNPVDETGAPALDVEPPGGRADKKCICKRFCIQEANRLVRTPKSSRDSHPQCVYTPLLDALTLEILQLYPRLGGRSFSRFGGRTQGKAVGAKHREFGKTPTSEGDSVNLNKGKFVSRGVQTDVGDPAAPSMDLPFPQGHRADNQSGDPNNSSGVALNSQDAPSSTASAMDTTLIPSVSETPEPDNERLVKETEAVVSEEPPVEHEAMECAKATDTEVPQRETGQGPWQKEPILEDAEVKVGGGPLAGQEANPLPPTLPADPPTDPPEENIHGANNQKEMETEFLRLSLGFKCDLFTLDKRLRLEERSRDLAEENLKKEIASCTKLLEALAPLCEEDNESHEIVKKLEKALQFLGVHTARVASRAEMLGAIHQESRVSKAVDVMIQHVENLKRMYAKEHAELEDLRELLHQGDRSSFSTERDEKLSSSLPAKPSSLRRVSMPTYTRSMVEPFGGDKIDGKFHKRSNSWKLMGSKQNENRPNLQRFATNYPRPDPTDEELIQEDEGSPEFPEIPQDDMARKLSFLEMAPPPHKCSLYHRARSWASDLKNSVSSLNKTATVSVMVFFLLAALASFLVGLSFQRPVEGAPEGTGDSWTALQQFLWPYTGLHHNGQPPV